jgi:hypothetical protein
MKPRREVNWRHDPRSPRASWRTAEEHPEETFGMLSCQLRFEAEKKDIRLGRDCGNSSGTDESGSDLDHFV